MATLRRFEDIEAWQRTRELVREVYRVSGRGAFSKDFALRDQMRKAAISIMSNIAEGFERGGKREFIQFLSVAKASVGEVRSQLYIALDRGYLPDVDYGHVTGLAVETGRMIGGFMRYLRRTPMKGQKRALP